MAVIGVFQTGRGGHGHAGNVIVFVDREVVRMGLVYLRLPFLEARRLVPAQGPEPSQQVGLRLIAEGGDAAPVALISAGNRMPTCALSCKFCSACEAGTTTTCSSPTICTPRMVTSNLRESLSRWS